jgi:7-cyano-7-deazaguanine synthase
MCSISGIVFNKYKKDYYARRNGMTLFTDMLWKSRDRGRDSLGLSLVYENGFASQFKYPETKGETPDLCFLEDLLSEKEPSILPSYLIANNRAEPTTEFVEEKRIEDVQPYVSGRWHVVHNGTIANDKELIEKFDLRLDTKIDSAVIPGILAKQFPDSFDTESVIDFLKENLIGSYSLAITNTEYPYKVILMTNYKPLYIGRHLQFGFYMFSSLREYFQDTSVSGLLHSPFQVCQVPPYTAVEILNGDIVSQMSIKTQTNTKKALVVCSGGLDSTVVAAKAIQEGYDVTLLHFRYGCRAEGPEIRAIERIGERLGCEVLFADAPMFKEIIGGSPLTGTGDVKEGVAGAEFAHEWVPARNLIMLSIATGIAESKGFGVLMLGNNLEESGAYPDNEMEFINKLNEVLPFATQVNKTVEIKMPVGNLMKHEIVKMGLAIGAPLDLCWSCYEAGEIHCGNCGPCFMRKTAFKINNAPEVIEYLND